MGDGLKGQWGVNDPKQAGSDKQSKDFKAAFEGQLKVINEHLQYTATHAEAVKHDPLAAKRDALMGAYQSALGQIDPAQPAKAQGAIKQVLDSAKALGTETAGLRKDAQKAFDDWQKAKPGHETAVSQIEALEAWEHKDAKGLREASDAIVKHDNDRRYAAATKAAGELATRIKPIHEEYTKQKAAKEKYEPALDALAPRLADSESSRFKTLQTKQTDIATSKTDMEKAAGEKDYVAALHHAGNLESQLKLYEEALAETVKAQETYEASLAELQALNPTTPATKFKKLETSEQNIEEHRKDMEAAAGEEDFVRADLVAKDLLLEVPQLAKAQEELEKAKADYEAALEPLKPRLEAAAICEEGALNDMREEIGKVQAEMEKAAADEEFVQALTLTTTLSTFLDSLESAEANEVYIVEFNGKKHCGTMAEIAALKAAIVLAATKEVVGPLKSKAAANQGQYNDLQALADDQYVIAAVLHTVGGTSLSASATAVAAQQPKIDALAAAIGSDPATAQASYADSVAAVNAAGKAISDYLAAIDAGGKTTIAVLQVVEVTCFAVAAACGAAVLAPAGASLAATMAANGITGAGFGALQTVAEEAIAPAAWGDADKINASEVASKAALSAVLNGAGGALGAAGGKGAGIVLEGVMVKLGCKEAAVRVAAKEIIEGGIGNAIQSAVSGTPDLVSGKTTWGEFWQAIATNFVAGGIAGRIAGKLGAKQAFDKPITGAELDAWARGFDSAEALGPMVRTPATK